MADLAPSPTVLNDEPSSGTGAPEPESTGAPTVARKSFTKAEVDAVLNALDPFWTRVIADKPEAD